MRLFFILFLLFFSSQIFAQTTGTGCDIGDRVAMEYLGQNFYYNDPTKPIVRVYRNTNIVQIVREQGYGGYQCGNINVYSAGSRWNGTANVAYPAVNEVISRGSGTQCVVAPTLYGQPTGEGPLLQYSYRNPTYCNVPLDDYSLVGLLLVGISGFYFIVKKHQLLSSS